METLKYPACTLGSVARLCRSWLSPGKATRISHGEKIALGRYSFKKEKYFRDSSQKSHASVLSDVLSVQFQRMISSLTRVPIHIHHRFSKTEVALSKGFDFHFHFQRCNYAVSDFFFFSFFLLFFSFFSHPFILVRFLLSNGGTFCTYLNSNEGVVYRKWTELHCWQYVPLIYVVVLVMKRDRDKCLTSVFPLDVSDFVYLTAFGLSFCM